MDYKVVYSGRKTISLCVKDGGLIVKAPYGTKKTRIEKIVSSHEDWVNKHIKKQKEKNEKYGNLTDEKIAELRKLAKQILPQKVDYYAKIIGCNKKTRSLAICKQPCNS